MSKVISKKSGIESLLGDSKEKVFSQAFAPAGRIPAAFRKDIGGFVCFTFGKRVPAQLKSPLGGELSCKVASVTRVSKALHAINKCSVTYLVVV